VGPSPRAGAAAAQVSEGPEGGVVIFGGAERAEGGGLHARGDAWLLEAGSNL
jgi:hypothetical protein